MANVKNAGIREIIIDRCLQNREGRTVQQMMDACNDALKAHDLRLITSPNTIRADFEAITDRWHKKIKCTRKGRNFFYCYEDPNFSIFNNPMSEDEIMRVYGALEVLERFEGKEGFEWIEELNAHLRTSLHMGNSGNSVIAYDDNPLLKGMQFFADLHDYIRSKQPITVTYRPYVNPELLQEIIHPYFLKQYNSRWFVLGYNPKFDAISTFALDRIVSIEKAALKFIENTRCDFEEYFKNVIGVTVYQDRHPEEILMEVDKDLYPYISSKPMHSSQKLIRFTKGGNAIVSLFVIPNYELKQQILSYGKQMNVISPLHLKDAIIENLTENLEKYQSAHFD
jgi:predicted DNA-binding transcriptional regulator YafY